MIDKGHFEKLLMMVCKCHNWRICEEPAINVLGQENTHFWVEDEDDIPCTTEFADEDGSYDRFMVFSNQTRDDVFKAMCEKYMCFWGLLSLEELELKLAVEE